jgi:hypothetical protein
VWRRRAAVALAAAHGLVLLGGVLRHGAAGLGTQHGLILALLLVGAVVALAGPARLVERPSSVLLLAVGVALLAGTVLLPTVESRGYELAAIGWLGLFVGERLASGRAGPRNALWIALVAIGGLEARPRILVEVEIEDQC